MKTQDLIETLSAQAGAAKGPSPSTRILLAGALAATVAVGASIMILQPRPDLSAGLLVGNSAFLLKLVFATTMVVVALSLVRDLSIPGRSTGVWLLMPAVPVLVLGLCAIHEVSGWPAHTSVHAWHEHVGASSWLECLWKIPLLSLPALLVLAMAVRRLAPTNLSRTGAYVGLAAGAIGAEAYLFHCHDDSLVFATLGYTLGVLEVVAVGAVLGPRVLRWTAR